MNEHPVDLRFLSVNTRLEDIGYPLKLNSFEELRDFAMEYIDVLEGLRNQSDNWKKKKQINLIKLQADVESNPFIQYTNKILQIKGNASSPFLMKSKNKVDLFYSIIEILDEEYPDGFTKDQLYSKCGEYNLGEHWVDRVLDKNKVIYRNVSGRWKKVK